MYNEEYVKLNADQVNEIAEKYRQNIGGLRPASDTSYKDGKDILYKCVNVDRDSRREYRKYDEQPETTYAMGYYEGGAICEPNEGMAMCDESMLIGWAYVDEIDNLLGISKLA